MVDLLTLALATLAPLPAVWVVNWLMHRWTQREVEKQVEPLIEFLHEAEAEYEEFQQELEAQREAMDKGEFAHGKVDPEAAGKAGNIGREQKKARKKKSELDLAEKIGPQGVEAVKQIIGDDWEKAMENPQVWSPVIEKAVKIAKGWMEKAKENGSSADPSGSGARRSAGSAVWVE